MIYYLNLGFILEQALVDIVKRYIDRQNFDNVYGNFHISVVNEHPFAHMIIDQNARCNDTFPSIVITSQSDSKPSDLQNMPVQYTQIGLNSDDINELINQGLREKTRINADGEVEVVKKGGIIQYEKIPGFILVNDDKRINKLKEIADSRTVGDVKGEVYGIAASSIRRDRVSVEIWAEQNQLKNEIYEHLRLLFISTLNDCLKEQYAIFHPSIYDGSINGDRSSNYNFDFDSMLCGSHITFEVDYTISQIILDTEINNLSNDIIVEVMNHVKEQ